MQFKNIILFASALVGFAIANPVPNAEPMAVADAMPVANAIPELEERDCQPAGKRCLNGHGKCCGDLHCGGSGLCV